MSRYCLGHAKCLCMKVSTCVLDFPGVDHGVSRLLHCQWCFRHRHPQSRWYWSLDSSYSENMQCPVGHICVCWDSHEAKNTGESLGQYSTEPSRYFGGDQLRCLLNCLVCAGRCGDHRIDLRSPSFQSENVLETVPLRCNISWRILSSLCLSLRILEYGDKPPKRTQETRSARLWGTIETARC